jgi:hypothetical protein
VVPTPSNADSPRQSPWPWLRESKRKSIKRREKAIRALLTAEIIDDQTHEAIRNLLVRAYIRTGGIPARIVHAGEGGASLPDLTADEQGLATLDRLDRYIYERVNGKNPRGLETSGVGWLRGLGRMRREN